MSTPLDVFTKHKATLVLELQDSVLFLAESCREAGIITPGLCHELTQVPDTNENKVKKLVSAISKCIEDQPVDIEPEKCVFKQFVTILRNKYSLVGIAGELETSLEKRASYGLRIESSLPLQQPSQERILTVNEIVNRVGISMKDLEEEISREHLLDIGLLLHNCLQYADPLGLSKAEIQGIMVDPNLSYPMKGQEVLKLWHEKNIYEATYRCLVGVCLKLKHCDVARAICNIVKLSLGRPLPCTDVTDNESQSIDVNDGTEFNFSQNIIKDLRELNGNNERLQFNEKQYKTEGLMMPNQVTSFAGGEKPVYEGLRHRTLMHRTLMHRTLMDAFRESRKFSADTSTIAFYKHKYAELKQQLEKLTEEHELSLERLLDKEKELGSLRFQESMSESCAQSELEDLKAKIEQLEEGNRELEANIVNCEQENNHLTAELQTTQNMKDSLLQNFDQLNVEVQMLTRLNERLLANAQPDQRIQIQPSLVVYLNLLIAFVFLILIMLFIIIVLLCMYY